MFQVRLILEESKANPHILDRWSNSPMDEARRICCQPVIDYLLPLITEEQNAASIIKWQDSITVEFLVRPGCGLGGEHVMACVG